MAFGCSFEGGAGARGQRDDLAAPAEPYYAPGLEIRVGFGEFFDEGGDLGCGRRRSTGRLKEVTELFALLFSVRWIPFCRLLVAGA